MSRKQKVIVAIRLLTRLARMAQSECEKANLNLPQYRALMYVSRGNQRMATLAAFATVSRPAVTALVDGLERAGMLKREDVEGDRRGVRITITRKGAAAMANAEERMARRIKAVLGQHSAIWDAISSSELELLEVALDEELEREVYGSRSLIAKTIGQGNSGTRAQAETTSSKRPGETPQP